MQNICKQLDEWEAVVWREDKDFEEKFCHGGELVSIYWNCSSMKVYYMLKDGNHITDSIDIEKWFEWLKNHCSHCTQGYVQDAGFVECNHCNKN